jgi:hypothetical protein
LRLFLYKPLIALAILYFGVNSGGSFFKQVDPCAEFLYFSGLISLAFERRGRRWNPQAGGLRYMGRLYQAWMREKTPGRLYRPV